jgi:hypothetical protein
MNGRYDKYANTLYKSFVKSSFKPKILYACSGNKYRKLKNEETIAKGNAIRLSTLKREYFFELTLLMI